MVSWCLLEAPDGCGLGSGKGRRRGDRHDGGGDDAEELRCVDHCVVVNEYDIGGEEDTE